ncbi:hypothetical protein [Cochlodiniinecator piscidefendens]|uniref:hypothetical protein n=1 Tax=Cochlodiniinecator piscidefendens TaxID=2715756 RepID=UPI00140AA992|nr:hypothetical protein [Cochlodiniinecator piscidefendens]
MTKSFISVVLAAALTITGFSAVPARADAEDIAKILLGLGLIAGIAAAVDNDNDHVTTPRPTRPRTGHPRPRHNNRVTLPERCLRTYYTDRGQRQGFANRCLRRHAPRVNLPARCEREWHTDRGWRTAYGLRCMRNQGFRVSRR